MSRLHFITLRWTQKQHYASLSAGWRKWITTQHLIWCLSQCGIYIFIHSVCCSTDGSAARVLSLADRTGGISIRRSSVYFDFHVYHLSHIHHNPVMKRRPACSWYGKLDILLFIKSAVFISHFYSWAPDLAVNVLKTDSALLDSWIKSMMLIMTLLALVCCQTLAAQSAELSHLHEVSWECCVTARSNLAFPIPLCTHDISPSSNNSRNFSVRDFPYRQ